jgi:Ca2+/Na+ antiporter
MKFSLFIDTEILKEYYYIKKNYLSKKFKLINVIPVVIIFLVLIGIIVMFLNLDPNLKVFLVVLLALLLVMYLAYLIARYQYFNSVKQMVKRASTDYLYNVEVAGDLMISEDDGVNREINVADIANIYRNQTITVVTDRYNDIVFCNDDFNKVLEEYPDLKNVPITGVDVPPINVSKKRSKKA